MWRKFSFLTLCHCVLIVHLWIHETHGVIVSDDAEHQFECSDIPMCGHELLQHAARFHQATTYYAALAQYPGRAQQRIDWAKRQDFHAVQIASLTSRMLAFFHMPWEDGFDTEQQVLLRYNFHYDPNLGERFYHGDLTSAVGAQTGQPIVMPSLRELFAEPPPDEHDPHAADQYAGEDTASGGGAFTESGDSAGQVMGQFWEDYLELLKVVHDIVRTTELVRQSRAAATPRPGADVDLLVDMVAEFLERIVQLYPVLGDDYESDMTAPRRADDASGGGSPPLEERFVEALQWWDSLWGVADSEDDELSLLHSQRSGGEGEPELVVLDELEGDTPEELAEKLVELSASGKYADRLKVYTVAVDATANNLTETLEQLVNTVVGDFQKGAESNERTGSAAQTGNQDADNNDKRKNAPVS